MKRIIIKNNKSRRFIVAFMLSVSFGILFLQSCKDDEVYEREQYKNVFALISESDNVARKFHNLGEESIGYIAASMGGTEATDRDVEIKLIEDKSLIDQFNLINYDTDVSKYARSMPEDKYDIETYNFSILSGTIGGRLPIKIRPDGLSPDSSYFIALRINSYSGFEANPDKSYILYQIKTKNYYAQSDGTTIYSMRAKYREQGSSSELEMPGNKIMHPISKNSIRIMAGNEAFEADMNVFNSSAIIVSVNADNSLKILPYKNINVTQVDGDPDYPNIFKVEDDGFKTYKTFLLRYNYVSGNTVVEMKEELRLEFNEEDDDLEMD